MSKKIIISTSDDTVLKLKFLAKEKENIRRKLVVTANKLVVIAKDKESVRRKLAVTAKEKENIRRKLVVTAETLKGVRETLEKKVVERTKELERARAKEEAMLAGIGDGVISTDLDGKIIFMNQAAQTMLGWHSENVVGKALYDTVRVEDEKGNFISREKRPMYLALTGTTTNTTTTTTGPRYQYVRKDKTKFPVAIAVTPITLDQKIVGGVEVFRDITKEKEIDQAKDEFVSLASHQLRTPPTSTKWFLEMLLSGEVGQLNEKQKEYFEEVYRNNQRMITLVNTLLNVSRIELGVFKVTPKSTNIVELTNEVFKEYKLQIQIKKLRVKEVHTPGLPSMFVDPKLLHIILQNIISNAIKYTPVEGKISVEISSKQKDEDVGGRKIKKSSLVIIVSDTGYGIPKNQYDKIFTKLFRADNVREKDTDGTGLGLYLAKSIVDHAQGDLWFESELNKGTIFYLAIPIEGMKKREGEQELVVGFVG